MADTKDIFETGLGCLLMPLGVCGFIVVIAALPLCFIVGIGEILIYSLIGLLLKPFGLDIFQTKISNAAFMVGCILLIVIVAVIFFTYPNIFFNLLLFGDDYFPRLKP